jgi:hypothetical protein
MRNISGVISVCGGEEFVKNKRGEGLRKRSVVEKVFVGVRPVKNDKVWLFI